MLIDLSELLMHDGKNTQINADIEMSAFNVMGVNYKIVNKQQLILSIKNIAKNMLMVETNIRLTLSIPCGRCLEEVEMDYDLNVAKEIDMKLSGTDELDFMEKNSIDIDKFVCSEIFTELPMNVLCNENCKGICKKCGINLNQEECGCEKTELDPRMSKILDIFNEYKEV